jgi:hypothetical protein
MKLRVVFGVGIASCLIMAGVNSKFDVLRNNQRFSEKYSTKWPCMTASKRGDFYAYCDTCACDISIKHSGQYDIKLHIQTAKHVKAQASNHSILNCWSI